MAEAKTFELHKKRVSIAMHQWLKTWQPPTQTRLECPFCRSLEVRKLPTSRNGNTLCCAGCQRDFSGEALPGCRCWFPGALLKCHNCPHYKNMTAFVVERLKALQSLSEAELDAIMRQPDFYERDLSSGNSKQSQYREPMQNYTLDLVDGIPVQLGLFEDV